jgi:uncharacterized membrane protein YsdA (DUF1294 family)
VTLETIVTYTFLINILSFTYMFIDKQKAIKAQWRISEKTFFMMAVAGGSIGVYLGMKVFRHKTKHRTFTIGIPAIFLLQVVLLSYYL